MRKWANLVPALLFRCCLFFLEFMERAWWLGELHEVPIHDESERESNDERNQKKKRTVKKNHNNNDDDDDDGRITLRRSLRDDLRGGFYFFIIVPVPEAKPRFRPRASPFIPGHFQPADPFQRSSCAC